MLLILTIVFNKKNESININENENSSVKEFKLIFKDFEQRIEEEEYGISEEGFEDEFYKLEATANELYNHSSDDDEIDIMAGFLKRLEKIRKQEGLYDEEAELDRMFPNRTDKSDPDGEWESGFSLDKFFGLD